MHVRRLGNHANHDFGGCRLTYHDGHGRAALHTCSLLNLAMLFIEGSAGLLIGSAALLADAVDFLEDAAVLGLAVVAIGWSLRHARQRVLCKVPRWQELEL
jgi:Co/Zn/Cd efflux system component